MAEGVAWPRLQRRTTVKRSALAIGLVSLSIAVLLIMATVPLPAAGPPPANPQATIQFDPNPATNSGDNIKGDISGAYVGGVNGVIAEMQGTQVLLNLQKTSGKNKRTFGLSYPITDAIYDSTDCTATGPVSPGTTFVQTQGYAIMWQLGAMQIGEVRATGIGFYANTPGTFRWIRTTVPDHMCATQMVVAYRQGRDTWQVTTDLIRLGLTTGAYGILPSGEVYDPDLLPVIPGDRAQLGNTAATFQGNYHMPFKLTVTLKTGTGPAPPPCGAQQHCVI
jgi:hypothetical protein